MTSIATRLDRIENILAPRPTTSPVFIEPRDCADREAFALACREAAGDAPCIVILPANGRETPSATRAATWPI